MSDNRRPLPVEHFERVAHIIRACRWMGTPISPIIEERFGVCDRTARRWVNHCKEVGLIGPESLRGSKIARMR